MSLGGVKETASWNKMILEVRGERLEKYLANFQMIHRAPAKKGELTGAGMWIIPRSLPLYSSPWR